VLDPSANCAAAPVVDRVIAAPFDDANAAAELAKQCDVITMEIEQIGAAALDAASQHAPLRPGAHVLRMVQDRQRQKEWLSQNGFPIGPYQFVQAADDLVRARDTLGAQLFVKACEGGYDGRSQLRFTATDDATRAFESLGRRRAVAEQGLDLELELSVLVARRPSGQMHVYPAAMNHHEQQVLTWSIIPASLPSTVISEANRIATGIADALKLEGILAIELFLLRDGRVLVNELAPRPHNSYHASELACPTSQFEQLVRCACDLPLGDVAPTRPSAIVNLFGDLWLDGRQPQFDRALSVTGTRLFLYGKSGARAGRKMGHIGAIGSTTDEALTRAKQAFSLL
jgi:5-(carboxyamino)imidazole ribonucleotide synthase